jgi:prepilin-type N-terminal cleavage/methylation domain-containing protein
MNMRTLKHLTKPRYRSRGFSMVEMMVALVITLILLAGIGQIFLSSKKSFVIQNTLGRIQENGRYAMDVLASDLRRAGYWGGNADISTITGSQGVNLAAAEECTDTTNGPSDWTRMLGRSVYGLDLTGSEKPSDTGNDYTCIKNAGATPYVRGDVLLVRYAHPSAIGSITKPLPCNKSAPNTTISDCYPNEYFLRSSLFRGRLFQGSDSEATENNLVAPALRTAELVAHAYYIGTSSNTSSCPADGAVPSLYRVSLVNGAFAAEEVAYGVDNLQVKYGVDTSGDSVIDRYYDADEIDSTDIAKPDWEDVIAARIWLLVRAECPETGYTNDNTYAMSEDYTPNDTAGRGYRRKLYTSTIKLRNR